TFEMTSTSPELTASSMRLNLALLLVVAWAVDMWFLLTVMCMWGRLRNEPAGRSQGPWPWLTHMCRGSAAARARLVILVDAKTRGRGQRRGVMRQERGSSSRRPQ